MPASHRSWSPTRWRANSATSGWGRMRKRPSRRPWSAASATCSGLSTSPAARTTAARRRSAVQQRRVDAHRAQAARPDAAVAVGDGQPLGERDGRVLRGRVGRRADLAEQPRCRRRREEPALAALEPARDEDARRRDVREEVDPQRRVPFVDGPEPHAGRGPRVRAEQRDRPERLLGAVDERQHLVLARDVAPDRQAADARRDAAGAHIVLVGHDHLRTGGGERLGERAPDARRPARHDGGAPLGVHRPPISSRGAI